MKYNSPTLINKFRIISSIINLLAFVKSICFTNVPFPPRRPYTSICYCILIVSCFKKIEKNKKIVALIAFVRLLMTIRLVTGKSLSKSRKFKKMLTECPWNPIIYDVFQFGLSFQNAATSKARLMEIVASYATLCRFFFS